MRLAAESAADRGAELVVLCGGDGTYMAGLTHLARAFGPRKLPTISLAPGGSSCTIARNWGRLLRDPVRHVDQVLKHAEAGGLSHTTPRTTLRVCEPAEATERVGFIFGAGMVASFFQTFYEKGGGGYGKAAPMIARIFAGSFVHAPLATRVLSPTPCKLVIHGIEHPQQAFTLVASAVITNLGLGLRVTHRGGEDPERPHLVAFALGIRACGMQYVRVLQGKPLLGARIVDALVPDFELRFPEGTGAYVLDGDLFFRSRVCVRAGPKIRVLSL
ncbi:MAG: hypothetical protein MUF54_03195 [Polyangiaceae bacterium]|nr:hypothetical protein [Polyangiaceae bacterium]